MSISKKAEEILKKNVKIDLKNVNDWKKKNFFGKELHLYPRDLVIFCIALEKEFGIRFPDEFINDNGFVCFASVVQFLENNLT